MSFISYFNQYLFLVERATLTVVTNHAKAIKRIEIDNHNKNDIEEIEAYFLESWTKGNKYQLVIEELKLMTSISACAYVENGVHDAIVFTLNPAGDIFSFAYQKSYTKYKKTPRVHTTEGLVRKIGEGPKPQFKFSKYDTFGKQKMDETEVKQKKEEEQPWYSRYWWALLIGGFLIMQVMGQAQGEPEEGAPAQGGGRVAASGGR
jgi:hypothetical protein